MSTDIANTTATSSDPVSNVLKWILLAVAVGTFAILGWATVLTYDRSPPQPDRFTDRSGATLMTSADIVDGKAGFQKADLMDYGSLYGMGSYYGEDYTASILVQLATLTQDGVAQSRFGKPFAQLTPDQQASARTTMQQELQRLDLTQNRVSVPDELAAAISAMKKNLSGTLATAAPDLGWTPAYSLSPQQAQTTADFLIYSSLTTVARRPDTTWSWTENWPTNRSSATRQPPTHSVGRGLASVSPS